MNMNSLNYKNAKTFIYWHEYLIMLLIVRCSACHEVNCMLKKVRFLAACQVPEQISYKQILNVM